MKAITLHQPWASLMAMGYKHNETRSWSTRHRGPLAIHAGTNTSGWGRRGEQSPVGDFTVERDKSGLLLRGDRLSWPYRLPLGAVVAIVSVYDVKSTNSHELCPDELEEELGCYDPDRYAWQCGSIERLPKPIAAVGHQGIWDWEPPAGLLEATTFYCRLYVS